MSTDAVPALFRRLVDDAALFPPGNAPMPVALAEHRHHLTAPYAGPRTGFAHHGRGVAEPLADLVALGLLDPALADHLPAPREEHA